MNCPTTNCQKYPVVASRFRMRQRKLSKLMYRAGSLFSRISKPGALANERDPPLTNESGAVEQTNAPEVLSDNELSRMSGGAIKVPQRLAPQTNPSSFSTISNQRAWKTIVFSLEGCLYNIYGGQPGYVQRAFLIETLTVKLANNLPESSVSIDKQGLTINYARDDAGDGFHELRVKIPEGF